MRAASGTLALLCLLSVGCETSTPPAKSPDSPAPPPRSARSSLAPRFTRPAGAQRVEAPLPPLLRIASNQLIVDAPPSASPGEAPISLTASDGTGLHLARVAVRAVVQGPLAFTELQLHFENRESRRLEGRFSITLPPGAAVSRFAMRLPTGWQEAEVVERQAARRAYEDFLHRRQDPALLEHEAGNQFSARVFPIEPNQVKELRLSYSQELPSPDEPYRLPLQGLPEIAQLDVTAIAGDQVTEVAHRNYRPTRDLLIRPPDSARASGLIAEDLVVTRLRLSEAPTATVDPVSSLLVLFDTSASRAAGFRAQLRELEAFLHDLPGTTRITIACFDQDVEPIYEGPREGLTDAVYARISKRGPLGASNLQAALTFAVEQRPSDRILIFTDGVITAGAAESGPLLAKLRAAGTRRLDVALFGGIRDAAAMATLTTGHLPQDGVVMNGDKGAADLRRRFSRATLSGVLVEVAGASWVWPRRLDGVQPGDDVIVYAELAPGNQAQAALIKLRGGSLVQEVSRPLVSVTRPLVERALVRGYLQSLDQSIAALDAKQSATEIAELRDLRHEAVDLSTRFRVLGNYTALLVLETAADYKRFSIDQKALADILVVGDRGIELLHRKDPIFASELAPNAPRGVKGEADAEGKMGKRDTTISENAQPMEPSAASDPAKVGILSVLSNPTGGSIASIFGRDSALGREADDALGGLVGTEVGDAYGAGGLGLVGRGRGGGGTGEAYGAAGPALRSRRMTVPTVTLEPVQVRGALSPAILRRIVRFHLNEVRFCYERELVRNPGLAGRVTIKFVIAPQGNVTASAVETSTLGNREVEVCVANAVRRWEFPRPDAGLVIVTYPFQLQPHGDGSTRLQPWQRPEAAQPRLDRSARDESTPAYSGKLAQVMALLQKGQAAQALPVAEKWRDEDAGDILALIALGEVLEARGDAARAARAYGSIIDLFPSRADLRRFAGERLERLSGAAMLALAADSYEKAVAQRPDHPAGHRLHAYVLLKQGKLAEAFTAIEAGANRQYPDGRFRGVSDVLREDVGLIGAAWAHKDPARSSEIESRLAKVRSSLPKTPSLRFVLNWETDANDVDFHIRDGRGGHAFYSDMQLPSGGNLYADVTTGYGPECFTIPGKPSAFPYKLEAHYYSRGPMGYGMGKLQIIAHDGHGGLKFVERPFVVMNDHAYVDLGSLKAPL